MKKVPCPHCKKEAEWKNNPFRPFCSERCRLIDLGEWAEEKYRIPVENNIKEIDEEEKESSKGSKNT